MAEKNCELLKGFGSCHSWKLQQPTEPRSISRHENQKYHPHTRLQNSPYFCVFKYATREQSNKRSGTKLKTESETWERERDLGRVSSHKPYGNLREPYGRVRLARFARVRLLRHALPISLLILRKKTTVLQSTHIHIKRVVSSSCSFYLMLSTAKVAKLSSWLLLICKIRKGTKKK